MSSGDARGRDSCARPSSPVRGTGGPFLSVLDAFHSEDRLDESPAKRVVWTAGDCSVQRIFLYYRFPAFHLPFVTLKIVIPLPLNNGV
jgi:hypothetical protein